MKIIAQKKPKKITYLSKQKKLERIYPYEADFKSNKSFEYKKYFLYKILTETPEEWDTSKMRPFHLFSKKSLSEFIGEFDETMNFYRTFIKFVNEGICSIRSSFEKIIVIFSPQNIKTYSEFDEEKDRISDNLINEAKEKTKALRKVKERKHIEDKRLNIFRNSKFYMDGQWNIVTLFANKFFLECSYMDISNGIVTAIGQNGKIYKGFAVVFSQNFLHINFIKFIKDDIEEDFYFSYQIKVHSFGSDPKSYYNGFRLLKSATVDRSYTSRCALIPFNEKLGKEFKRISLFPFEKDLENKISYNRSLLDEYNKLTKDTVISEVFEFLQCEENNLIIGFQEPGRRFVVQETRKSIREVSYRDLYFNNAVILVNELVKDFSNEDALRSKMKRLLFCLNKAFMHGFNGSNNIILLKDRIIDPLNKIISENKNNKLINEIESSVEDIVVFNDEYFYINSKFQR